MYKISERFKQIKTNNRKYFHKQISFEVNILYNI